MLVDPHSSNLCCLRVKCILQPSQNLTSRQLPEALYCILYHYHTIWAIIICIYTEIKCKFGSLLFFSLCCITFEPSISVRLLSWAKGERGQKEVFGIFRGNAERGERHERGERCVAEQWKIHCFSQLFPGERDGLGWKCPHVWHWRPHPATVDTWGCRALSPSQTMPLALLRRT